MGGVAPGCWYCQLLTLLRLSFHLLVSVRELSLNFSLKASQVWDAYDGLQKSTSGTSRRLAWINYSGCRSSAFLSDPRNLLFAFSWQENQVTRRQCPKTGETNSGGSDIVKTMCAGWSGSISSAEAIHNIVIISMGWDALVQPVWCEFSSCSLVPTPLTPCQEAHIYLERMCCVEGAEIWRWLMCKFEETFGAPILVTTSGLNHTPYFCPRRLVGRYWHKVCVCKPLT